jgi:hypothetical protein
VLVNEARPNLFSGVTPRRWPEWADVRITPRFSSQTTAVGSDLLLVDFTGRVFRVDAQGQTAQLEAAGHGSVAGSQAAAGLEDSLWLCPIEDRRRLRSSREGMLEGFSLGSYLLLVDYTGRLFRSGEATISPALAGIFDRLGSSAEIWRGCLEKLRTRRFFSRFFAAGRENLRAAAARLNARRVRNLAGCPAP